MVIYEAMTPQCLRSVVQVLVVRVKIGVVTYEAIVRVDIGVVTSEAITPLCGGQRLRSWLSEWI